MEDYNYKIARLISLYVGGKITEQEKKELIKWLEQNEQNRLLFERIVSGKDFKQKKKIYQNTDWEKSLQFFEHKVGYRNKFQLNRMMRYVAILLLPLAVATAFFFMNRTPEQLAVQAPITAGTTKAILTLADGQTIVLSEKKDSSSLLKLPSNISLMPENKQLVYQNRQEDEIQYNVLKTPRGGEYKLTLSDGTFIHLNAGSELKYPVVFDADKREVYLSGEAWFEVTKDTTRPFYVKTDDMRIRVYGTSFAVNTLNRNKTQTVLVEGEVGICATNSTDEQKMKPFQLGEFNRETGKIKVMDVDVLPYVAWKNGLFVFSNESLENIINKLTLWYDIDFFYQNEEIKNIRFSGYLKRYDDISVILKAIQQTVSVRFEIKERTVMVFK